MTQVYIALGANLESPRQQLDEAVIALSALAEDAEVQVSPYYRSAPMGDVEQPDYINAVACLTTQLAPIELLDALQTIELQQGRVRNVRWGARTLDLDLLLYGDEQLSLPRLTVPHYGMKQRSFVLVPLSDLAPQLILPCGTPISALIDDNLRAEVQQLGADH
ncbi:2-amino-4-hydroxy-6-hydroxymethyldihydropteridine diphosphokinase [Shewanella mesophila]|uniref:2-amino-4-hydroxy-6- hydroxymethyldihydropteridine diphosphokinase n=1 Tax=Shewanella mesophila TaxID=2864208 RepID=UPI001C65F68D|nr:2-amino-4-hydroxy-6-hydroxymethyldihydropteridine diphosphokinase [Shewanella mesophila]QYJ85638.1 2-amino-4-hydroxy-6-hydroxymethyldihydropteridine diphosphokinase [Shewanella mesophila]